jgi:hypothetical protein
MVQYVISNSHYKNRFFESPPKVDFQKTDFGVSSACGAGNTKIGFIMRIAEYVIILILDFSESKTLKNLKSVLMKGL